MNQVLRDALWIVALGVLGAGIVVLGTMAIVTGAVYLAPHLNAL